MSEPPFVPHSGTWLLYVLTIEGSYRQNIERPAKAAPDTMQYWITDDVAWDVRTFAIDKDIRAQRLDYKGHVADPITFFDGVAKKAYRDIIQSMYRLDIAAGKSSAQLRERVAGVGLNPNVEWTVFDFPLWLPEDAEYYSRGDE
jgi:hypothetical protein